MVSSHSGFIEYPLKAAFIFVKTLCLTLTGCKDLSVLFLLVMHANIETWEFHGCEHNINSNFISKFLSFAIIPNIYLELLYIYFYVFIMKLVYLAKFFILYATINLRIQLYIYFVLLFFFNLLKLVSHGLKRFLNLSSLSLFQFI